MSTKYSLIFSSFLPKKNIDFFLLCKLILLYWTCWSCFVEFFPTVVATLVCLFWRKGRKMLKQTWIAVCMSVRSMPRICVCVYVWVCVLGYSAYVIACYRNVLHIKSWQSFHMHKFDSYVQYCSKRLVLFWKLLKMTHFCTQDTLLLKAWMCFSDYEDKQESQWTLTVDASLTVSFSRASNWVSCLFFFFCSITKQCVEDLPRICFHSLSLSRVFCIMLL